MATLGTLPAMISTDDGKCFKKKPQVVQGHILCFKGTYVQVDVFMGMKHTYVKTTIDIIGCCC